MHAPRRGVAFSSCDSRKGHHVSPERTLLQSFGRLYFRRTFSAVRKSVRRSGSRRVSSLPELRESSENSRARRSDVPTGLQSISCFSPEFPFNPTPLLLFSLAPDGRAPSLRDETFPVPSLDPSRTAHLFTSETR